MTIFYLISLFVFLVSIFFTLLFNWKKLPGSTSPLPLGRTGFPVIGESYEFLSAGWKGFPEKFIFDRMAKYSSQIFKTHLLGVKAAVVCGADGNKFLFTNEGKIVQSWWPSSVEKIFPSSNQTSSVEEALNLRRMLPTFFKPEGLQRYIGTMDRIAQKHFASHWENKDEVEVFPLSKNYTLCLATALFVSIEDPEEVASFIKAYDVIGAGIISIPIDLPGTPYYKAGKASDQIKKKILAIMKQRKIDLSEGKATNTQDILSHMLTTVDENGKFMNELDVADKILGLLIGGYKTSSSVCTFIAKYLAELPEIYQGVYKEQMEISKSKAPGELLNWKDIQNMKYSWNVAREVLRLTPPVQGGFREALTDCVFKGFSIPKGWMIHWTVHSTNRNPELFPEPNKFDPTRFEGKGPAPYTFVPFGGGPKICPGIEFARLLILVFMHNLVKRFKWEKIIADEKTVVDLAPFPAKGLPVRLIPHDA